MIDISRYPKLSGRKILVTGAAGFIGSNICNHLSKIYTDATIYALDCFGSREKTPKSGDPLGFFKNLNMRDNLIVIHGDVVDTKRLKDLSKIGFDFVLHQAAVSDTTCSDADHMMRVNYTSFTEMLEIFRDSKMVYASSAGVYGNSPVPNTVWRDERPENIYSYSKLLMDYAAKRAPNKVIGLRYFNVYGHNEFYKGKTSSMVLQLGLQAAINGEVKLFKHGEQRRDFIHIEDVVDANLTAMKMLDECSPGSYEYHNLMKERDCIFNVGSGRSRSFNELVLILEEYFGRIKVSYIDNKYRHFQEHTKADLTNGIICRNMPPKSLEDGVRYYVKEIKAYADELKRGLHPWWKF